MTFLVTGGAGFIGSFLVGHLVQAGETVRVVDDGSTGSLHRIDPAVEIRETDIARFSEDDWAQLLRPGDTVFHLAARKLNTPGVSDQDLIDTNLRSTVALARAAKKTGVRKMVFSSSLYTYGHRYVTPTDESFVPLPQTLYGMSKLAGEHSLASILESSDVEWASARLYFVYGPKQYPGSGYKSVIVKNFERIRDSLDPLICGSGNQALDYVYVEDVVDALLKISVSAPSGSVYNVSSGNTVTINDLTALMLQVSGKTDLTTQFIEADWTDGTVRGGSHAKLSNELGWAPHTSLRTGLEHTWADISDERGALGCLIR